MLRFVGIAWSVKPTESLIAELGVEKQFIQVESILKGANGKSQLVVGLNRNKIQPELSQ